MLNFNQCFEKVEKHCFSFFKKNETKKTKFKNKKKMILKYLIPLSFWINERSNKNSKIYFLGLSGGQGTGKTTIATLLEIILTKYFKKKVCVFSIDDFYKTREEREKLSKNKHSLLKTRGVPGTHDINLIFNFLNEISIKKKKTFFLPRFDKSIDDREKKSNWKKISYIPDIVILDGWCVGAKPQKNKVLIKSVNSLEKKEDSKYVWRKYVNQQLKSSYKILFGKMNDIIYLNAPNFGLMKKWRIKQETKLRVKSIKKSSKVMTNQEILRFMMFYQRITQQMLKDMPKISSAILKLDNYHQIKNIKLS